MGRPADGGQRDPPEALVVKDRAIYEKMVLPGIHPDGEVGVASIREALGAFKATGEVKPDVDLDKMLDLSRVRYAQEVLGRYER